MGVGWQPTAVKGNNVGSKQQGQGQLEACYGCSVGWQPTAVKGNNVGSQQQGQGQLEACCG